MNKFLLLFVLFSQTISAQKLKKADKVLLDALTTHVTYLSNDKLEGRRTGTPGEALASTYIADQFKNAGLIAKGDNNTYLQQFEINEGRQINKATHFIVNGNDLKINSEFFPLTFCANNVSLEAAPTASFQEKGQPWFFDLKEMLEQNKSNPHFDLAENIKIKANSFASKGATAIILHNSSSIADDLKFETKQRTEELKIPVIYITKSAKQKYFADDNATLDIKLKIDIGDNKRYGHNVIGYLNNNTANTIIIGAHYDHLGYGEDHNSLSTGAPAIHNGADDNASGTAAVIELAKMLKASKLKNNNYLFITFSGEELGLFGSKYFTEHPSFDLASTDFMVNLDMVGRLKDDTHGLTIGGYGTSPSWNNFFSSKEKYFTIKFDSSGVGPSDHTSFYNKNIPVLFFFTGLHSDYHKPTDDVEKINFMGELQIVKFIYNILDQTDKKGKLAFTKTRDQQMSTAHFTVTLGIMPDYTYSGNGVRADGIVDGKLAQKAGIKAGDVITSLNDYKFYDVTSYMDVLGKFKKGDAAKVKVLRGKEELSFDIVF